MAFLMEILELHRDNTSIVAIIIIIIIIGGAVLSPKVSKSIVARLEAIQQTCLQWYITV
jgi:hypothetical protein